MKKGGAVMRKLIPFAAGLVALPIMVVEGFAQPAENGGWYMHPNMGWGGGLMMILIGGAIIFLLFVLARSVNAMHQGAHKTPRTAIEILKERFARGEIDKEEFEEKRDILLR
jgi:putative membrane protein